MGLSSYWLGESEREVGPTTSPTAHDCEERQSQTREYDSRSAGPTRPRIPPPPWPEDPSVNDNYPGIHHIKCTPPRYLPTSFLLRQLRLTFFVTIFIFFFLPAPAIGAPPWREDLAGGSSALSWSSSRSPPRRRRRWSSGSAVRGAGTGPPGTRRRPTTSGRGGTGSTSATPSVRSPLSHRLTYLLPPSPCSC